MILSDITIRELCSGDRPLITPFHPESISLVDGQSVTSYGASSYGYDLSLSNKFKLLKTPKTPEEASKVIDPCNFDPDFYEDIVVAEGEKFILPPRGCALAVSVERMDLRRNITGICMQKSTIARAMLEVVVTPLEAGWKGFLTLEFFNKTDYPIALTPGMGIVQLLFLFGDQPCETSYADRSGKYQNQAAEPVAPRRKETTTA